MDKSTTRGQSCYPTPYEANRRHSGRLSLGPNALANVAIIAAGLLAAYTSSALPETASPPAQETHCLLHKKSSKAVDFTSVSHPPKSTPRTGLCQQSNRSPPRRNGNWKIARRDRRPKSSPRGPKYRKLPTRDRGVPA